MSSLVCFLFVCVLWLLMEDLEAINSSSSDGLYYDWNVSLSNRALLGVNKQVIVINDQFPGPMINATTNDVVAINVRNNLPDPLLITWNGLQLRRNSWQDGVQGTNCPIQPGENWTYNFQFKDQIGSFFYFPTLLLQKAAGGYGAIRVNNRQDVVPVPFPRPYQDVDLLIGDWYNSDYRVLRSSLDDGDSLTAPDGILINGFGPRQARLDLLHGETYRLRISNVGLKTSFNFRIDDHLLQLVEVEGSYTIKQYYSSLDVHVGQSYSVLVKAKNQTRGKSYYMVASSRFNIFEVFGIGVVRYPDSKGDPFGPVPSGPVPYDYMFSLDQARSIRWDLSVGAARPIPQGSYRYGTIGISKTLVLENGFMLDGGKRRYTVNGVSFVYPDTPLKLADYFRTSEVFQLVNFPDRPPREISAGLPSLGTSVIGASYRSFYHIVFQNPLPSLQTWHLDGYNFFVVGMDYGLWNENKTSTYNMVDAISRSTVQVYPLSWTAVLVMLDNQGMWDLRSQDAESWYLGQEVYIRVKGVGEEDPSTIPVRDEAPIPDNVMLCGRAPRRNHMPHS